LFISFIFLFFLIIPFFKDNFGQPYSQDNLSESVAVTKKILGIEPSVAQKRLETLQNLLFRFTLDGLITLDSVNFNNFRIYGNDALDQVVYRIFNKPVGSKIDFEIPPSCPSNVADILDEAISSFIFHNYRATGVLLKSSIEQLLSMKYKQEEGREPKEMRVCRDCGLYQLAVERNVIDPTNPKDKKYAKELGEKHLGFMQIYEWALKKDFITEEYKHLGPSISRLGAIGSHTDKYTKPDDLRAYFQFVGNLIKSLEIEPLI
jgi:hypothetical protein